MNGVGTVEALLAQVPPEVAATARELIARLRRLLPDAVESCEGGDFGLGTAPGYRGLVFVVTPGRDSVRLGIADGATLEDPAGLLEGSGKRHRFVRVRPGEDLDRRELEALLQLAASRAHRLGPR